MSIIQTPIGPPTGFGKVIALIIKAIKAFVNICGKSAEEAGKTDQTDSLDNIERISKIFVNFKEQVHVKAVEVENAVKGEVNYYVEELHNILDENSDMADKYGVRMKQIEREINRISNRINGTIDNELSKTVSLDNAECKEIIKMIPGAKKEAAMSSFMAKSIKSALDACCIEIRSSLEDIYDDVEYEIVGTVESIQKQAEQLQNSFSAIDEANYEETAKRQMVEAYYLNDVCDIVLNQL